MTESNLGFDPDMSSLREEDKRPSRYHEGLKRKMNDAVSQGADGTLEGQALNKAIDKLEEQERENDSMALS